MEIFLVFWGLLLIGLGFLCLSIPTKIIRFRNSLQGTKTEITKASLAANKIGGIFLIIFGSLFIIGFIYAGIQGWL